MAFLISGITVLNEITNLKVTTGPLNSNFPFNRIVIFLAGKKFRKVVLTSATSYQKLPSQMMLIDN